ncbi:SH3 domain-containing protein [Enterocloster clostridioformis]|uniref:SH3 domain-containing protein n=2 Tax=Enterocloster clostridioformis TaxID=1531 RepID=UPI0018AA167B|nr:SH3 domain-containing protein [Enterocloster clostridioformis]MDU1918681.1 SH3 domain-containing protein [Coprobacillus sp.]
MARKELDRYNISLWDSQIHQMEMLQRSMRSSIIEAWKPALGMTKDIKHMLESPMTDWMRQNESWIQQMSSQIQPMFEINEQIKNITKTLDRSMISGFVTQISSVTKDINIISQSGCNGILGIAEQISPVINNLDLTDITSNLERIQAQLSHWDSSLEEIDYDDISVNDDGSLCYQDQCVTQPEINDIWNTFVQNCENLGSKAIEAIKDKAWVVQWIYRLICIITALGLYKEIEEHIHKGVLEVRSHANGWDKMFYIKKDNGARVYSAPDAKSEILGRLDYEQVIISTDIQPFWIKFEYQMAEGQTTEAWIATCNLIRYDKIQNNHMAMLEEKI